MGWGSDVERNIRALEENLKLVHDARDGLLHRVVNLEQQVANQALEMQKLKPAQKEITGEAVQRWIAAQTAGPDERAFDEQVLKSQAAATQATEHPYAPLRSDTKPLLEMSAFVRKVASSSTEGSDALRFARMRALIEEAQEILKRST